MRRSRGVDRGLGLPLENNKFYRISYKLAIGTLPHPLRKSWTSMENVRPPPPLEPWKAIVFLEINHWIPQEFYVSWAWTPLIKIPGSAHGEPEQAAPKEAV